MAPRLSRKRQARLQFTPVSSSSPQRSEAHVRISNGSNPAKRRKISGGNSLRRYSLSPEIVEALEMSRRLDPSEQVNSLSAHLPTPDPSSQLERLDREEQSHISIDSSSSSDVVAFPKRPGKTLPNMDSDDEDPIISPRRPRKPKSSTGVALSSEEESDAHPPVSRRKAPAQRKRDPPPSKKTRNARSFLSGGTSGNAPINHVRMPSSSKSVTPVKRARQESAESSDDDSLLEELRGSSPPKKAKKSPSRPKTLRNRRSRISPELSSNEETLDLEDDEDCLKDTELRKSRTRGGTQMSKRDQNRQKLEELAQKRLNRKSVHTNTQVDAEDEDSSDRSEQSVMSDERASENEGQAPENLDGYESDFVEEDGDLRVNLANAGVPLHLTSHASWKAFDYFKVEVEWMIHNKLDPAFERSDEIYKMAHQKLDDEVKGHAQSTFNSSAWTAVFVKALQSRPDYFAMELDSEQKMEVGSKCEACNRSKHPPKYKVTLTGNSYDKNTLERLSYVKNDDSEDESHSSSESDSQSEELEPQQHFFVGRFCYGNAEIAHTLHHWRYQLNQAILQWLRDNDHLTAEKVVERENWNRKKREKYANKIVDGMNDTGEMKALYAMFKNNLEAARSAKPERFSRGA